MSKVVETVAEQVFLLAVDESRIFTFNFTDLIPGDTINAVSGASGAYTLGVTGSSLITIGTPTINAAAITADDAAATVIAIGKAVQVRLSPTAAAVVGTTYVFRCLVTTTLGDRLGLSVRLRVIE